MTREINNDGSFVLIEPGIIHQSCKPMQYCVSSGLFITQADDVRRGNIEYILQILLDTIGIVDGSFEVIVSLIFVDANNKGEDGDPVAITGERVYSCCAWAYLFELCARCTFSTSMFTALSSRS